MSLKAKLITVLVFLVLLPVLLASWKIHEGLKQKQEEFTLALNKVRGEENQKVQDLFIPTSEQLVASVTKSLEQEFKAWVSEVTVLSKQVKVKHALTKSQQGLFIDYIKNHPDCLRVTILDRVGGVFLETPDNPKAIGRDDGDKPSFKLVKDTAKIFVSGFLKENNQTPYFLFCAPVYNSLGKFDGAVKLSVDAKVFTRLLQDLKAGKSGYAVLLDKDGWLLYHPDPKRLFQENWLNQYQGSALFDYLVKMTKGEKGHGIVSSPKLNALLTYAPVADRGLSVGMIVPSEDFLSPVIPSSQEKSLFGNPLVWLPLLIALLCVVVGSFLIVLWLKPWGELFFNAAKIAGGEFDTTSFDISRADEAGTVGKGFARVLETLKETTSQKQSLEITNADQQMKIKETQGQKEWVDELLTQKTEAVEKMQGRILELEKELTGASLLTELYALPKGIPGAGHELSGALSLLCRDISLDRAVLFLADEKKKILKYAAGTIEVPAEVRDNGLLLQAHGMGIASLAAEQQVVYNIQDVLSDSRVGKEVQALEYTTAFVAVPVIHQGRTLGVVLADNVNSQTPLTQEIISQIEERVRLWGAWLLQNLEYEQMALDKQGAQTLCEQKVAEAQKIVHGVKVQYEALSALAGQWQMSLDKIKQFVAQNLASPEPLSAGQQGFLGTLIQQNAVLEKNLNDLVEYARMENGEALLSLAPVSLGGLIKECLVDVKPLLEEKKISLKTDLDAEIALNLDAAKIKRAFRGFFLAVGKNAGRGSQVTVLVRRQETQAFLAVADQEQALSLDQADELFTQFHGSDSLSGSLAVSTGLTLPLLKKVLDVHHAVITVASAPIPNRGNIFSVIFPMARKAAAPLQSVAQAPAAPKAAPLYQEPLQAPQNKDAGEGDDLLTSADFLLT